MKIFKGLVRLFYRSRGKTWSNNSRRKTRQKSTGGVKIAETAVERGFVSLLTTISSAMTMGHHRRGDKSSGSQGNTGRPRGKPDETGRRQSVRQTRSPCSSAPDHRSITSSRKSRIYTHPSIPSEDKT